MADLYTAIQPHVDRWRQRVAAEAMLLTPRTAEDTPDLLAHDLHAQQLLQQSVGQEAGREAESAGRGAETENLKAAFVENALEGTVAAPVRGDSRTWEAGVVLEGGCEGGSSGRENGSRLAPMQVCWHA
jgi:hypothetical protein